jgi:hypothetical protein
VAKRLLLTIVLALLIPGVGHIYLGIVNNGIIILVVTIALGFILEIGITPFVPEPFDLPFYLVALGLYIWQIGDAYKQHKKLNIGQTQVTR